MSQLTISATTPFRRIDLERLRNNLPELEREYVPEYEAEYVRRNWQMPSRIDRVYVHERARNELRWTSRHGFRTVIDRLSAGTDLRSPLAKLVGSKGYHGSEYAYVPYPVE